LKKKEFSSILMNERRLSQPYLTKVQNQEALKRRQSIHGTIVHPKNDPKISKINASCLMSRRSKRYSVANAVTVTGVTEALLVGLLSKEKKDDDLCSLISSASELFTSLDVSDSLTDLTSDDSSNKTLRNADSRKKKNVSKNDVSTSDESNFTTSIFRDDADYEKKNVEEHENEKDSEIWIADSKKKLVTQV